MAVDRLKGTAGFYDVIVIGSGLGGLTSANHLAKQGYSVLLLEHHYQYGGLATWFRRKHKHVFDISLHGFPVGMIKSCKRYWTDEIASAIERVKSIRFKNPDFDITTTFDREDFSRILEERFSVSKETIQAFFDRTAKMNFYDHQGQTTQELFDEFFPNRPDIHRFLMEPIAYANGSTLDDPAISYGIVFSNFMKSGAYIFKGGTDQLIGKMVAEAMKNGVEMRKFCLVEKILVEEGREGPVVKGIQVNGREIGCKTLISNANLKNTLFKLLGKEHLPNDYLKEAEAVRLNNSSCQVYFGIKEGERIPDIGELVFTSEQSPFSSNELLDLHTSSRTFSMYYPDMRLEKGRYTIVASLNARWKDWANMPEDVYKKEKDRICAESLSVLERFIPGVGKKINWTEASTPKTVERYTTHMQGASFGTKFEGLSVSINLPERVKGLYHAGSVGIIMSGWLGTINYGIIVADKVDRFLRSKHLTKA